MTSRPLHLRIAGVHAERIRSHLFPSDGKEAVAFALCGRHNAGDHDILLVQEVHPISYNDCMVRTETRVTWSTEVIEPLLEKAYKNSPKLGVVKFHSHPGGFEGFSATDDVADRELFPSIYGCVDDDGPHASVILLPDGRYFGRAVNCNGAFDSIERILVVGHNISLFTSNLNAPLPDHASRHAQIFGSKTANILRQMTVGVIGCSGTGSLVVEMLARLGVRKLVLVDADRVEYRNLNRIVGTTAADAATGRPKVEVLGENVSRIGLGTQVLPLATEVGSVRAVKALASCDLLLGCMDSHDGRRTLNRLACFYVLPYIDCGVRLAADGNGGIAEVSVGNNYVQPGGSTLAGRKAIRNKQADAEAEKRLDIETYRSLHKQGYIEGVNVNSPAVISVNALAASLAVNELLARLHPFRYEDNEQYASVQFNVTDMLISSDPEDGENPLGRALGHGDVEPLLYFPDLSENE